MSTTLERRIMALEGAGRLGPIRIGVVPLAIAAEPALLSGFRTDVERNAPAGARILLVNTGVPRHEDPRR